MVEIIELLLCAINRSKMLSTICIRRYILPFLEQATDVQTKGLCEVPPLLHEPKSAEVFVNFGNGQLGKCLVRKGKNGVYISARWGVGVSRRANKGSAGSAD